LQLQAAAAAERAAIAQANLAQQLAAEAEHAAIVRCAAETAAAQAWEAQLKRDREFAATAESQRAALAPLPMGLRKWLVMLRPYTTVGAAVVCTMLAAVVGIGFLAPGSGNQHTVETAPPQRLIARYSATVDDGLQLKLATTLAVVNAR
jgi:ferric-dicitrate binding protein FerR (iron transport regulator)